MVNWLPRRSVSLPPQPTIAGPCHVSCDTMILVALPPIPEVAPQDNAHGQNRSSYLSLSLSQQPIYIYVCIQRTRSPRDPFGIHDRSKGEERN